MSLFNFGFHRKRKEIPVDDNENNHGKHSKQLLDTEIDYTSMPSTSGSTSSSIIVTDIIDDAVADKLDHSTTLKLANLPHPATASSIICSKSSSRAPKSGSMDKPKRKFKSAWKFGRSWLSYDAKLNAMFCKDCLQACISNTFTSGCGIMKFENVIKHEKSQGHQDSIKINAMSSNFQQSAAKAVDKSKTAIIAAMKNVIFAAQHCLPSMLIPDLHDLCIDQGVVVLKNLEKDKHTTYRHHESISEMERAIADVISETILDRANKSPVVGIMIDESTDIAVNQNMIFYLRFINIENGLPETHFIGIKKLESATAEKLLEALLNFLKEKHISLEKLSSICTDGAATMIGSKSGLTTRLKQICPGLLSFHCLAHRLALACADAANAIPYMVKYQGLLNTIYKYFEKSPKHTTQLKSMQEILKTHGKKFQQQFHTRWLSFEGSVQALIVNLDALIAVLSSDKSAQAQGLLKSITCYKFLHVTYFIADALTQLALLSKHYQSQNIDFSIQQEHLLLTIHNISKLKEKSGINFSEFNKFALQTLNANTDTLTFRNITFHDSTKQRKDSNSICEQFIDDLVQSLNKRLNPEYDVDILHSLNNCLAVHDENAVWENVLPDLEKVSSHFVKHAIVQNVVNTETFFQECAEEWKVFHNMCAGSKSKICVNSVQDVCKILICQNQELFPHLSILASIFQSAPLSTADCERGFSRQNLIKTKLRNRLNAESLEKLMLIAIENPYCPVNLDVAFVKWATSKNRRIL